MRSKNIAKVMSSWLLHHDTAVDVDGESFEIRFSLLRVTQKNCFRVIHEEYLSKYQDAGNLYKIDKKIDTDSLQEAIDYLEKHGVSIGDMS